jgi:hypothetical protein
VLGIPVPAMTPAHRPRHRRSATTPLSRFLNGTRRSATTPTARAGTRTGSTRQRLVNS